MSRSRPTTVVNAPVTRQVAANDEVTEVVLEPRSRLRDVSAAVLGWAVPVSAGYSEFALTLENSTDFQYAIVEASKRWGGLGEFVSAEFISANRLAIAGYHFLNGDQPVVGWRSAADFFKEVVLKTIVVDAVSAQLTKIAYNTINVALGRNQEDISPVELFNVEVLGTQATRLALVGVGKTAKALYSGCTNCFFSRKKPVVSHQPLLDEEQGLAARATI